jgi:hypothetical protein
MESLAIQVVDLALHAICIAQLQLQQEGQLAAQYSAAWAPEPGPAASGQRPAASGQRAARSACSIDSC